MGASDFWASVRASKASSSASIKLTFGELSAYDPTTHTGKFHLVMFSDESDPSGQTPIETDFMQIMTPWSGGPTSPSGMQFVPKLGAQALVLFADEAGLHPICGLLLYNATDTAPFTDGKSNGWLDPNGSSVRTTVDGATPGDGLGGAKMFGSSAVEHSTQGGHNVLLDDAGKVISVVTSGGHTMRLDDAGQVISILSSGGHHISLNDVSGILGVQPAGGITPTLNLGSIVGGPDMKPAITHADIESLITDSGAGINVTRLNDLYLMANAVANVAAGWGVAGIPGSSAIYAALLAIIGSSLTSVIHPPGSAMVNIHT